jgi:hypothetical protein
MLELPILSTLMGMERLTFLVMEMVKVFLLLAVGLTFLRLLLTAWETKT